MSSTTVAEFANELKKSTETLIDQLKAAGVLPRAAASDVLTDADKHSLAELPAKVPTAPAGHGTQKDYAWSRNRPLKSSKPTATGRARTIQVEVRKKRTFVRRDDGIRPGAVETDGNWKRPSK